MNAENLIQKSLLLPKNINKNNFTLIFTNSVAFPLHFFVVLVSYLLQLKVQTLVIVNITRIESSLIKITYTYTISCCCKMNIINLSACNYISHYSALCLLRKILVWQIYLLELLYDYVAE